METWKKQHYQALMQAAKAGYFGDDCMLQRAYAMYGFADHFLTDSFSSGHVRTPRIKILEFYQQFFDRYLDSILNYIYAAVGAQLVQQVVEDYPGRNWIGRNITGEDFCADTRRAAREFKERAEKEMANNSLGPRDQKKLLTQYVGGAVAKVLHDDDNTPGLDVRSRQHPGGWKAFGDGKLNPSFQNYAVEASKADLVKAVNIGIDFKNNKTGAKPYEKIEPLVYPTSPIEDFIPEVDPKSRPQPEWRIDQDVSRTMDKPVRDRLTALVRKYLNDKKIEEIIAQIPETLEWEIRGPNIDVRPRAATRHVLREFRDDPVGFITRGAATSPDLEKVIATLPECR